MSRPGVDADEALRRHAAPAREGAVLGVAEALCRLRDGDVAVNAEFVRGLTQAAIVEQILKAGLRVGEMAAVLCTICKAASGRIPATIGFLVPLWSQPAKSAVDT